MSNRILSNSVAIAFATALGSLSTVSASYSDAILRLAGRTKAPRRLWLA
jgi:hypothetical protein